MVSKAGERNAVLFDENVYEINGRQSCFRVHTNIRWQGVHGDSKKELR